MTRTAPALVILRAAARPATTWRNGGGVTREIAVSPPGAALANFDWRISMAEVTEAGPFSRFEGVDRVLTVLAGTLHLAVAGQPPVLLNGQAAPYHFPGDANCWGETRGGPVTDLNVMVRRGRATGRVRRAPAGGFALSAETWLFLALAPGHATINAETHVLKSHDAVLAQNIANCDVSTDCPGLIIELRPVA